MHRKPKIPPHRFVTCCAPQLHECLCRSYKQLYSTEGNHASQILWRTSLNQLAAYLLATDYLSNIAYLEQYSSHFEHLQPESFGQRVRAVSG